MFENIIKSATVVRLVFEADILLSIIKHKIRTVPFHITEEPYLRELKQYAIYTFAKMCMTIYVQLTIQLHIPITAFKVGGHRFFSLALLKNSQFQIHVV